MNTTKRKEDAEHVMVMVFVVMVKAKLVEIIVIHVKLLDIGSSV